MKHWDNCTNTVSEAAATTLTRQSIEEAMNAIRNLPPAKEVIDNANCGVDYMEALKRSTSMWPKPSLAPIGFMGSFAGFKIFVDPTLPPDTIEFRNPDNEVIYAATLSKGDQLQTPPLNQKEE